MKTQQATQKQPDSKPEKILHAGADYLTNQEMVEAVEELLNCSPPFRLSRNLRKIFVLALFHEHELLLHDGKELVNDLMCLFHFLDVLDEEIRKLEALG
jgi:hypothetical protein